MIVWCIYCISSLHFCVLKRHVPQPSSFNGIRYSTRKKGSTHYTRCHCSRKGITRHRFLLPKLHVGRCNVVARRDAWSFVRKVASERSIYRPGRFYSSRAASTYDRSVQLRSIVVVAGRCTWRDALAWTDAHACASITGMHSRIFHFYSRRVSTDKAPESFYQSTWFDLISRNCENRYKLMSSSVRRDVGVSRSRTSIIIEPSRPNRRRDIMTEL